MRLAVPTQSKQTTAFECQQRVLLLLSELGLGFCPFALKLIDKPGGLFVLQMLTGLNNGVEFGLHQHYFYKYAGVGISLSKRHRTLHH